MLAVTKPQFTLSVKTNKQTYVMLWVYFNLRLFTDLFEEREKGSFKNNYQSILRTLPLSSEK